MSQKAITDDLACFNPYFTGSNSGSETVYCTTLQHIAVSILILLEVILEDEADRQINTTIASFNPYFTGSNSGSISKMFCIFVVFSVSILILLEVILEGVH